MGPQGGQGLSCVKATRAGLSCCHLRSLFKNGKLGIEIRPVPSSPPPLPASQRLEFPLVLLLFLPPITKLGFGILKFYLSDVIQSISCWNLLQKTFFLFIIMLLR